MFNNRQQPTDDDSLDIDDMEGVLIKDGKGELKLSRQKGFFNVQSSEEETRDVSKSEVDEDNSAKIAVHKNIEDKQVKESSSGSLNGFFLDSDQAEWAGNSAGGRNINQSRISKKHRHNNKIDGFLNRFFNFNKKGRIDDAERKKNAPEIDFVWFNKERDKEDIIGERGGDIQKKDKNDKKSLGIKDIEDKDKYQKDIRDAEKNLLLEQARLQEGRIKALSEKREGLFFSEQDAEEIKEIKKRPLINNYPDVGVLARRLLKEIGVVSTLKINLIPRLKNIIDAYLRDVRAFAATKEILQRSLENGGLNLTAGAVDQIMEIVKEEYEKIHTTINDVDETEKYVSSSSLAPKIDEKARINRAETAGVISKKTAKDAQVGVFSDEIKLKQKNEKLKIPPDTAILEQKVGSRDGDDELRDWENGLDIPPNLRVAEIQAPEKFEKLFNGTTKDDTLLREEKEEKRTSADPFNFFEKPTLNEMEKSPVIFKTKKEKETKKESKKSWWSKIFGQKPINRKIDEVKKFGLFGDVKNIAESSESEIGKKEKAKKIKSPNIKRIEPKKPEIEEVESKSEVFSSRIFFARRQKNGDRPKIEDVKVVQPRLTGPIEELSNMTLEDFRRLGPTAEDMAEKIMEKIDLASKESFNQKVSSINAWRKSRPNRLYLELGEQSLSRRITVDDLINRYKAENKTVLTRKEFDAINRLNKELRY